MRKTCFFVLALELLSFFTTAQVASTYPVRIPVNNSTALADWSELLEFKGYVALSTDVTRQVLNVQKLLFVEDKIVVLDVDTDFEAVRVFDGKTGDYLYDIGKRVKTDDPENGFKGIIDMEWNPDRKFLRLLSRGHLCFTDYALDGTYLGSVKIDHFGDDLVYLGGNKWLMYNEFSSDNPSDSYFLYYYNDQGKITEKKFPYAIKRNGAGYSSAGYLMRSGNNVWFNPTFSDTVYSVAGTKSDARFIADLGPRAVPVARRDSMLFGNELLKYDFLEEGFFSNGRYCVFQCQKSRKISAGIFDGATGRFYESGNLDKTIPFNQLCQGQHVFAKDNETFAIVMPIRFLIRRLKNADRSAWEALAPGLYDLVAATPDDIDNPVLFYFKFK